MWEPMARAWGNLVVGQKDQGPSGESSDQHRKGPNDPSARRAREGCSSHQVPSRWTGGAWRAGVLGGHAGEGNARLV